ncbi:uncharacterized protein TNCV_2664521 [Trichonephila clavipes]|nr:uncharacterized protein TNCV_2664521 [Trichonephila clavipes]
MCTNCSSEPAMPAHIFECLGLTKQDLADVPSGWLFVGLSESVRCHGPGLALMTNWTVQQQYYCIQYIAIFGLAIHQNDHQARRRFVEWAQNEIAVVPDFQKRILFSDEAHFWLNGYVNKQNCRFWNEANPQVYVETPLHPEKLTVWCALWAGGILPQNR